MQQQVEDQIVKSVLAKYVERSNVGLRKYGTTLDREDLTIYDWIEHAQQEAMDFVLYLERIRKEIAIEKTKSFSEGYREAMRNVRNTEQNIPNNGTKHEDKLNKSE